jgi:hypothetical protein
VSRGEIPYLRVEKPRFLFLEGSTGAAGAADVATAAPPDANIENAKLVSTLLEVMEEYRDLSLVEWNFRALVKEKYALLLQQQLIYWKQRGSIKWVKFGDAWVSHLFFQGKPSAKLYTCQDQISCI